MIDCPIQLTSPHAATATLNTLNIPQLETPRRNQTCLGHVWQLHRRCLARSLNLVPAIQAIQAQSFQGAGIMLRGFAAEVAGLLAAGCVGGLLSSGFTCDVHDATLHCCSNSKPGLLRNFCAQNAGAGSVPPAFCAATWACHVQLNVTQHVLYVQPSMWKVAPSKSRGGIVQQAETHRLHALIAEN